MSNTKRKLLTTKQAAEQLGVSVSMLAKDRMNKGDIPYSIIGKKSIRYDYYEILRYIKRKKKGS